MAGFQLTPMQIAVMQAGARGQSKDVSDLMLEQAKVSQANAATEAYNFEMEKARALRDAAPALAEAMQEAPEAVRQLIKIDPEAGMKLWQQIRLQETQDMYNNLLMGGGTDQNKALATLAAMKGDASALMDINKREAETRLPGYEPQEGYQPTPDDAKIMKKARASSEKIKALSNRLSALVGEKGFKQGVTLPSYLGGAQIGSPEYKQMERLYKAIQLEQKNVDDLGALVGADFQFIRQAPDPLSFVDQMSYGTPEEYQEQMKEYLDTIDEKMNIMAESYGYKPTGILAKETEDELDAEAKRRGIK